MTPEEFNRWMAEQEARNPGAGPTDIDWTGTGSARYQSQLATPDAAALRRMRTEGFRGAGASASWADPAPSRATVRDLAGTQSPDPKDVEAKLRDEYAKNEAARVAAGEAPRNVTDPEPPPTDEKEVKVGTGNIEDSPRADADPYYGGAASFTERGGRGVYTVRLPNGQVIHTNTPGKHTAKGATYQEAAATDDTLSADVASGPAGSVYAGIDARGLAPLFDEQTNPINLPTDEDRSPGWAVRKAYRDLYASGDLSMDPRDIMDRRRWEEQEEARESDLELARARRDAAIRQSQVDPYRMAQIEAEGKYGGEVLKQEGKQRQMMVALQYYAEVGSRISAAEEQLSQVPPDSAQAAALQEQIDRLTQERRELANIALGFNLRDPEFNPFAAMMGAAMAPTGGTGGE